MTKTPLPIKREKTLVYRLRVWLIRKLGGELPEPKFYSYKVTEVYRTGEKRPIDVKRGRKPVGYNLYGNNEVLIKFLPFKELK